MYLLPKKTVSLWITFSTLFAICFSAFLSPSASYAAPLPVANSGSIFFNQASIKHAYDSFLDVGAVGETFTVEMWIKPTYTGSCSLGGTVNATNGLCAEGLWAAGFEAAGDVNIGSDRTSSGCTTETQILVIRNSQWCSGTSGANSFPAKDTWAHIAWTVDSSGKFSLYINGVRKIYDSYGIDMGLRGLNRFLYIGKSDRAVFTGYMSNIRLVKGAVLYSGISFSPPTAQLETHVPVGEVNFLLQAQSYANLLSDSTGNVTNFSVDSNYVLANIAPASTPIGGVTWSSDSPFTPPPSITSLSKNSGIGTGGTSIVITGNNLDSTTSVTIGGVSATITNNTSSSVTITTPPGSDGVKNLVLMNAGGTVTSVGAYTYFSSFTVSYSGGIGSTGSPPTQGNRAPNETFTVADSSQIVKTGFTFSKWRDERGSDYLPGATYTVTDASVLLTAQWTVNSYAVTFNANGGSNGGVIAADYNSNVLLSAPSASRGNYSLVGWAETTTASVLSSWNVVADKTLYAIWNPKVYTITYSPESGTAITTLETFTVLSMPSTWQTPTRSNYAFDGWYTDKTWATLRGTGSSPFTSNETETVYAKWTQSSLVGLSSPTSFGNIIATPGNDGGISATRSGTRVEVDYYADSLPSNTTITAYLQGNTTRAASVLTGVPNLLLSVVVAWKAPDETVPDVDPTKNAIRMKITNADIKSGAKVYSIVNNTSTLLATATQDGFVVIQLRVDPEIVIANPVVVPTPPSGGSVYTPAPTVHNSEKLKAEEAKAVEELMIARARAEAEIKAAQDAADLDAKLKAEADAQEAARIKAEHDAALAADLVAHSFLPDLTLYSISSKLKLSTFDGAYLSKYISTLKNRATVTCIGYIYPKQSTIMKARALAINQATAVCKLIKAQRKTLVTKVLILPASRAPKAAAGAKWVAVSYRVDGYKS